MYVCMYVCACICMYIYIYTFIHIHHLYIYYTNTYTQPIMLISITEYLPDSTHMPHIWFYLSRNHREHLLVAFVAGDGKGGRCTENTN